MTIALPRDKKRREGEGGEGATGRVGVFLSISKTFQTALV